MNKSGRPPIEGAAYDSSLPLVRCSSDLSNKVARVAEHLNVSVAEVIRSFVDFCTTWNPSPSSRSLIRLSQGVARGESDGPRQSD